MLTILADPQDIYETNSLVNDFLQSFNHSQKDEAASLKIKKNRRKHLKERERLIKIGVLKRS